MHSKSLDIIIIGGGIIGAATALAIQEVVVLLLVRLICHLARELIPLFGVRG